MHPAPLYVTDTDIMTIRTKWWIDEADINRLHAQANRAWRRLRTLINKDAPNG